MSEDKSPIIRLENISKQFPGVLALDRISVNFYPGDVHAVIGENGAGKSTLMNVLAGEVQPDSGKIFYNGEACRIPNPYVSQQMGIGVVYQELALCPNLSVAENISLNTIGTASPLALVKRRRFLNTARNALNRLGMENVPLNQPVGQLSVAQQQMVEIAKAISCDVKVLILDEPNSALTEEESEHLFQVVRQLREEGVAIIYVSHKLEEVLRLSDRITIQRDGHYVDTIDVEAATVDKLIANMVGRVVDDLFHRPEENFARQEIAFEVSQLTSKQGLKDVSFSIHAGEVVGIAGLPDSGKEEVVECCFGMRPYSGEILLNGKSVQINSPAAAIEQGMALIPADRRRAGAILTLSVQNNIVAANLKNVSRGGFLDRKTMREVSQDYVKKLDIRISSLLQKIATLSGGNQQKVILARGLATQPSVLLLHEPTRGIDVGAKAEIYSILHDLASEGVAILIVSSELPELLGQCDRILAMHAGAITGHFDRRNATEESILACAMGQTADLN
ncbi:MAG: sugar ABC transporter ATP-binding protein [bacterium]|nr:sugar ABC transporter ATP-binding protein [bacterium]